MEVASSTKENSLTSKISIPKECAAEQKHESSFENVQSQAMETPHGNKIKSSSKPARKKNRFSAKSMKKKYTLRSSAGSTRVLRSRVQVSSKPPDPINNSANVSSERDKKRKKRKRTKKILNDEYSRIRKHLKYLLTRTNYEHSLIDAYAGEGWRGQSAEKIKPEKELQRATSEISRCKLKIRDLFKQLDSLCAEGKFHDSLFDSEGQISSDDIFCAKCGSKDLSADNDIILCDGTCIRGFHQMCLEPPLTNEEIPPGDEGWLCPGCDCKVDCTDLVNDCLGTDLSIDDSWEKVFPEVAATSAGDKLEDNLGLPSDDSEDNDYDPDGPEVDEKVETDGSSSEESDFTSASDDAEDLPLKEQNLGLPSDDSEDDDYDPSALDADAHVKEESSSSDFTSDSGDSGPLGDGNESSSTDEVPVSISADGTASLVGASHRRSTKARQKKQTINSELLSILEPDSSLGNASPVSGRRHREQLDYKKLHDETYGNGSSDSSDDEDWTDVGGPGKKKSGDKESVLSPNKNLKTGNIEESQKTRTLLTLDFEVADKSTCDTPNDGLEPDSIGKGDTNSASRRLGKAETERLCESFGDNAHPTRNTKEKLAAELGITLRQVSKWFDHRRWKLRVSTTSPSKNSSTGTSRKSLQLEPRNVATNGASNGKRTTNFGKPVIVLGLPSPNSGWDVERRKRMIGEITPQKSGGPAVKGKEVGFSPKGNSSTIGGDTVQSFKKVGDSQCKRTRLTLDSGGADKSAPDTHTDGLEPDFTGEGETKSAYRTAGKAGTQRLLESFGDNRYPTREAKEKLAAELGMTLQQVSKWFDHRRWKLRHSKKGEPSGVETASPSKENSPTRTNGKSIELEPRNLATNGTSNGGRGANLGEASIVLALESPKKGGEESRECMNVESTPQKSMAPELIHRENGKVDDMALTVVVSNNETPIKCTPTDSMSSQSLRRSGRIKIQTKK